MAAIEPQRINSIQASTAELDRIRASYTKRSRLTLPTIVGKIGFWLLIVGIILYTLFPFYWAVASSLTPANDLFKSPVPLFPTSLTLDHYKVVLQDSSFPPASCSSPCCSGRWAPTRWAGCISAAGRSFCT